MSWCVSVRDECCLGVFQSRISDVLVCFSHGCLMSCCVSARDDCCLGVFQ